MMCNLLKGFKFGLNCIFGKTPPYTLPCQNVMVILNSSLIVKKFLAQIQQISFISEFAVNTLACWKMC